MFLKNTDVQAIEVYQSDLKNDFNVEFITRMEQKV